MELDDIVYLYCFNDLRDIIANELTEIDETGLKFKKFDNSFLVLKLLKKHLFNREDDKKEMEKRKEDRYQRWENYQINPIEEKEILKIFEELLKKFKNETQLNQQSFRIYLIPFPPISGTNNLALNQNKFIGNIVEEQGIGCTDLYPIFLKESKITTNYEQFFF